MKLAFMLAVTLLTLVPAAFGQATSARAITKKVAPPPPVPPSPPPSQNQPARPPASVQNAATSKPVAAAPREKTKEEKNEIVRKTVEFQMKRAEQGSATSQYDLGLRYLNGDGVEKSPELARKWLEASAKQGNSMAAAKLAELEKK